MIEDSERQILIKRWLNAFPTLPELEPEHHAEILDTVEFKRLNSGDVAYYPGQACLAYVMCIAGRTRVFKTSESGRSILLYQVGPGETCVLTASCLLSGGAFPVHSTAETDALLAALPAKRFQSLMRRSVRFREFVLGNYGDLLCELIALVDEVAFSNLDQRLARRLLAEADTEGRVLTTHQQLAFDLGSVREVISRYLSEWERMGWVHASRGCITLRNRHALAAYGGAEPAEFRRSNVT